MKPKRITFKGLIVEQIGNKPSIEVRKYDSGEVDMIWPSTSEEENDSICLSFESDVVREIGKLFLWDGK